jgi:hypothetical protein
MFDSEVKVEVIICVVSPSNTPFITTPNKYEFPPPSEPDRNTLPNPPANSL